MYNSLQLTNQRRKTERAAGFDSLSFHLWRPVLNAYFMSAYPIVYADISASPSEPMSVLKAIL